MSAPNPRKRTAPGASPTVQLPQQMQPQYGSGNVGGDQVLRWNGGVGDTPGYVDGNAHANNLYGLAPAQPQYPQAMATQSNSLARRQMNHALVPANPRPNYDNAVDPWASYGTEENALLQQNPGENVNVQDSVEVLEEMAQKAKRESQAKRKQIPPFVQKLSSFLEERKNEELIRWSEKGDSFIVLDEDEFARKLIPELFKHNNYASFVRQLNMYGFHKRVGLSDNSMRASERKNKSPSEYSNPYFRRGHPNLLWLINKPKGGSKAKKGNKNQDGDNDSDEDLANEEILGQGLGASNPQATRSLPSAEAQPMPKKDIAVIRDELNKVRDQQKMILGAINRLQHNNNDLYSQAVMFQTQHDRHQNSINAILNFLANVFRKTLEDQGNSQNVSDIISSMISNQNQGGAQHGNVVVDLGDFVQQLDPTYGTPHKKARGLLPPIPNQNQRGQSARASPAGSGSSYQPLSHHNPEMGTITELIDGSPTDTSSPNLRQELENNPHERMMKIINDHNATNSQGMDLPEAAEIVAANAPNTLNNDQRSKLVDFMNNHASSVPSGRTRQAPSVNVTSVPVPTPNAPRSTPSMNMPRMSASASVSPPPPPPPPADHNPPPSLSPIMQSPVAPPSLNQISSNQVDLAHLERLQNEQDAKIHELGSMLGPLSPSGHIPGLGEGTEPSYFEPAQVDLDQYFDSNAFLHDGNFGGDGNDFNFNLDTDTSLNNSLDPAQMMGQAFNNTPSPAGTEEIVRDDLKQDPSPCRGVKRQRVG